MTCQVFLLFKYSFGKTQGVNTQEKKRNNKNNKRVKEPPILRMMAHLPLPLTTFLRLFVVLLRSYLLAQVGNQPRSIPAALPQRQRNLGTT